VSRVHHTRVDWDSVRMVEAIQIAKSARDLGERPFGCIITDDHGRYLATASGSETPTDPTCHSEVVAIREACRIRGSLLQGCTIYSTHEPCMMCCGAILHSKLSRVVYGSARGDLPQLFREYNIPLAARLNDTSHPPTIRQVLKEQCCGLFAHEIERLTERNIA
jgi:tRNA(adenine34) deaminase